MIRDDDDDDDNNNININSNNNQGSDFIAFAYYYRIKIAEWAQSTTNDSKYDILYCTFEVFFF